MWRICLKEYSIIKHVTFMSKMINLLEYMTIFQIYRLYIWKECFTLLYFQNNIMHSHLEIELWKIAWSYDFIAYPILYQTLIFTQGTHVIFSYKLFGILSVLKTPMDKQYMFKSFYSWQNLDIVSLYLYINSTYKAITCLQTLLCLFMIALD